MSLATEYLNAVTRRFKNYKELGDKTFIQLNNDADYHYQPDEASNSIAVIIQHMSGNMLSRWTNILTEDGEKTWRKRDEEFGVFPNLTKKDLLEKWEAGWACLFEALSSFTEEDLLKTIYIRREGLTLIDAINRQLAHYPYHVGQIVYIGRMLRNTQWQSLSIVKNGSEAYNNSDEPKDPAKKF
jgi:hypothetical protein